MENNIHDDSKEDDSDLSISCSGIPKGGCKVKCDKARDKSDTAYDSCRQHAKSP